MTNRVETQADHAPVGKWVGAHGDSLDDAINALPTHLDHAIAFDAPELFEDYVSWLAAAGRPRGVDTDRLRMALDALAPADAPSPSPVASNGLQRAREALDVAGCATTGPPDPNSALLDWRRRYLGFLLAGLRKDALDLLRRATQNGLSADRIYLEILAPTLQEVGWLWQIGRVTVAQEHFCTAVTQFAMASLYDHQAGTDWNGRTVVVAGPGDERHEVGARMVADLLERAGWNAVFLGANMPANEVPQALSQHRADLLALSCTMTPHLLDLRAAIRAVRVEPRTAGIPVLVGGRPFALSPGLWQRIGADGTAADAAGAVRTAATLVIERSAGKRAAG